MNNLVFIKHMGGKKHYLFEVPMAIKLKKGDYIDSELRATEKCI
jgi:hypothetical protein